MKKYIMKNIEVIKRDLALITDQPRWQWLLNINGREIVIGIQSDNMINYITEVNEEDFENYNKNVLGIINKWGKDLNLDTSAADDIQLALKIKQLIEEDFIPLSRMGENYDKINKEIKEIRLMIEQSFNDNKRLLADKDNTIKELREALKMMAENETAEIGRLKKDLEASNLALKKLQKAYLEKEEEMTMEEIILRNLKIDAINKSIHDIEKKKDYELVISTINFLLKEGGYE